MPTVTRACTYPSYVLDSEAYDSGVYIMVMHLDHELDLEIGSKGMMHFNAGYYMYVGSAKANLRNALSVISENVRKCIGTSITSAVTAK